MKKIICRADGNANTGLGHLYRLFALYEIYKDYYEVIFVTKSSSTLKVIIRRGDLWVLKKHGTFTIFGGSHARVRC